MRPEEHRALVNRLRLLDGIAGVLVVSAAVLGSFSVAWLVVWLMVGALR